MRAIENAFRGLLVAVIATAAPLASFGQDPCPARDERCGAKIWDVTATLKTVTGTQWRVRMCRYENCVKLVLVDAGNKVVTLEKKSGKIGDANIDVFTGKMQSEKVGTYPGDSKEKDGRAGQDIVLYVSAFLAAITGGCDKPVFIQYIRSTQGTDKNVAVDFPGNEKFFDEKISVGQKIPDGTKFFLDKELRTWVVCDGKAVGFIS